MQQYVQDRVIAVSNYILETGATVRDTAKVFLISKSTVHKDVTTRLEEIDLRLFKEVAKKIQVNKSERHLRGGIATKEAWKKKLAE